MLSIKANSNVFALFLFFMFPAMSNAGIFATHDGALVADTDNGLTWVSDGRLLSTLANESDDPEQFLDAVIAAAGGVIYDTPNHLNPSGVYNLSLADFSVFWGTANWYGAQAFVQYLNSIVYMGYSDWRLPRTDSSLHPSGYPDGQDGSPPISSSELAMLFYGQLGQVRAQNPMDVHNDNYYLFTNLGWKSYWSETELAANPAGAWVFNGYSGYSGDHGSQLTVSKDWYVNFLPVRTGALSVQIKMLDEATTIECTAPNAGVLNVHAEVLPDSTDPVSSIEWYLDSVLVDSGEETNIEVALGAHTLETVVTSVAGITAQAYIEFSVVDTVAPSINAAFYDGQGKPISTISRSGLNFVTVHYNADDACDPQPTASGFGGVVLPDNSTIRVHASLEDITLQSKELRIAVTAEDAEQNRADATFTLQIVE